MAYILFVVGILMAFMCGLYARRLPGNGKAKHEHELVLTAPLVADEQFVRNTGGAFLEGFHRHSVVRLLFGHVSHRRHYLNVSPAMYAVLRHYHPEGGRINDLQLVGELERWHRTIPHGKRYAM